ncbi:MAG: hypothetical protein ABJL99_06340 [Aliishimia sp.]
MITHLITVVDQCIGFALTAGATAREHTVIGTTCDGRDGTPVVSLDPGLVGADMGEMDADEDQNAVAVGNLDIAAGLTIAEVSRFFRFSGEEIGF